MRGFRSAGVAGLFADLQRLRQARVSDEAADTGSGVRRRCRKIADALSANVPVGTEIAASHGEAPGRKVTMLSELLSTSEHPGLDAAHDAIGPDTIAKFLLTSGSTGNPKAVINTQRMICANQVMLRETLAFLKDEPPVIVDWAAVESYLCVITISADAVQWRLDVSRRRQGRCPAASSNRAQSSGGFADGLFQRAKGL